MRASPCIAAVALPTPAGDRFDYRITPWQATRLRVGCRVEVPFGKRRMIGVVVSLEPSSTHPEARLKSIARVIDETPVLPGSLLELMKRAARYYHHPLGEVIFTGLPRPLRKGTQATSPRLTVWSAINQSNDTTDLNRAPKQRAILELLQHTNHGLTTAEIARHIPAPHAALRALLKKNRITKTRRDDWSPSATAPPDPPLDLTAEQREALQRLEQDRGFAVTLLDGVTGSGKTEVYLQRMASPLESGRQVLVLVPEISLTPQLFQRFSARFPGRVARYHSGMSNTERLEVWRRAARGEVAIVLGTRSAVFLPLPRLGLVIVDEEHDPSLKQGDGFRYHARNLAVFRGQIENCPVILGSATPSLETLMNVERNRYARVRLTRRAGNARPPTLHLVDLRRQRLKGGLSATLIEKMHAHLDEGRQVLLFLNRRGYAPALLCHECGFLADCPRCSAHMTWHATGHALRCHHCGHHAPTPSRCPDCGSNTLQPVGQGTQKIEEVIQSCFPNHPAIRIDRDSMSRKHALEASLEAIRTNRYRIIIGTQMLAKGHDFPNITLVGMIDIDQGLFSSDYHAPERLVQQVLQVSGRAGRGDHAGEVVIQTMQPEHPLLQSLLRQRHADVTPTLLEERRLGLWPPYRHIALFRASAHQASDARLCLESIRKLAERDASDAIEWLGPAPAPLERRAGRYRFQLILRSDSRSALHQSLDRLMPEIRRLKAARKARWSLDIDPTDLS